MRSFILSPKWAGLLSVAGLVLVWHTTAVIIHQPLLMPTPEMTLRQIAKLIITGDFWRHLGATVSRGMVGFGFSLFIGFAVGLPAGRNDICAGFFRPVLVFVRSTPVVSVIILAMIWFRRDWVSIFVTFLMVFPIITQNLIEGLRSIPHELIQMTRVYRVRKHRVITRLYLPWLAPFLAAGVSAGLGMTWKVLVAAEVLAYPTWGIGSQMDTARVFLQTEQVFAWTVIVVALGFIFDHGVDFCLYRIWPKGLTRRRKGILHG